MLAGEASFLYCLVDLVGSCLAGEASFLYCLVDLVAVVGWGGFISVLFG